MSQPRKGAAAAAVGARILVFGGQVQDASDNALVTNELLVLDTGERSWNTQAAPCLVAARWCIGMLLHQPHCQV